MVRRGEQKYVITGRDVAHAMRKLTALEATLGFLEKNRGL
jgi:hypothetical protein